MFNLKEELLEFNEESNEKEVLDFDSKLDRYFNVSTDHEKDIDKNDPDAYFGIDHRALHTSYFDYFRLLRLIDKEEVLVDLGAGSCRGSLLSYELNLAKCVSYEFQKARTIHAKKVLPQNWVFNDDLSLTSFIKENNYYLYFPKGEVLDKIIVTLLTYCEDKEITLYVCESHGDVIEYLDKILGNHKDEFKLSLPRHYQYLVSYKITKLKASTTYKENLALWLLFNRDKQLIIKYESKILNKTLEWIVPTLKLEWIIYNNKEALITENGRVILIGDTEPILGVEPYNRTLFTQNKSKVLRENGQILFEI